MESSVYGIDGEPVLSGDSGVFLSRASYDERGNNNGGSYFGTDGKPVLNHLGYASFSVVYDERGRIVSEDYYGTDGELVFCEKGFASYRAEYDESGKLVGRHYLDETGKEIDTEFGMRNCIMAYPVTERENRYRSLDEIFIIVRLGEWDYTGYYGRDDETMYADFQTAMNKSAEEPVSYEYLRYDKEEDRFLLFTDIFRKGTMGLRISDRALSDSQYQKICEAAKP